MHFGNPIPARSGFPASQHPSDLTTVGIKHQTRPQFEIYAPQVATNELLLHSPPKLPHKIFFASNPRPPVKRNRRAEGGGAPGPGFNGDVVRHDDVVRLELRLGGARPAGGPVQDGRGGGGGRGRWRSEAGLALAAPRTITTHPQTILDTVLTLLL